MVSARWGKGWGDSDSLSDRDSGRSANAAGLTLKGVYVGGYAVLAATLASSVYFSFFF